MAGGGDSTTYRVTVYTSDLKGAGTDAGVFIQLMGRLKGKEVQVSAGRDVYQTFVGNNGLSCESGFGA